MNPKDRLHDPNRRLFLVATGAVVAVGCLGSGLAGCGGVPTAPPGPQTTALTVADLAVGQSRAPVGGGYIIARDAQGFYAYSDLCTHQGCALPAPTGGSSRCPCHGAVFDDQGNNLQPNQGASARLPDLAHYAVSFDGYGSTAGIIVDTSVVEADRTRRVLPLDAAPDAGTSSDGGIAWFRGGARSRRRG